MAPDAHRPEVPELAQSPAEEIANGLSHGLGLVAILGATPFLIAAAARHGAVSSILGAALFAGSAALLYLASMLYHFASARRKGFYRMLDHVAIFFLIAGTYTPFALGPLKGTFGWTIFAIVWLLAFVGILFKVFARFRFPYVSTAMYIGMGWLAVFIIRPLAAHLPVAGLLWLVAGGLAYTAGTLFYHRERMRYSHLVWHMFVLAGTGCHFVAVLCYAT
jgi:hemolysin III